MHQFIARYLWIQSGKESPVHGKDFPAVCHRSSRKLTNMTEVKELIFTSQVAEIFHGRIIWLHVVVHSHDPAWVIFGHELQVPLDPFKETFVLGMICVDISIEREANNLLALASVHERILQH